MLGYLMHVRYFLVILCMSTLVGLFYICQLSLDYFTIVNPFGVIWCMSTLLGLFYAYQPLLGYFMHINPCWIIWCMSTLVGLFYACQPLLGYFMHVNLCWVIWCIWTFFWVKFYIAALVELFYSEITSTIMISKMYLHNRLELLNTLYSIDYKYLREKLSNLQSMFWEPMYW